ncbi:MAG: hypothetical protein IPQ09_16200 [Myxococcales bacterium]|nr:hypothetical protein [Myxococcales bacterium]
MLIPVGLILRLLQGLANLFYNLLNDPSKSSAGYLPSSESTEQILQREHWTELEAACTGDDQCVLVLGHNDWDACEVDGVPVPVRGVQPPSPAPGEAGYRERPELLGAGPHGLRSVCPGRHVVTTRVGDRAARLEVCLFPREARYFRLDRASATFVPYEASEVPPIAAALAIGLPVSAARRWSDLVHYGERVAMERRKSPLASPREAMAACLKELKAIVAALLAAAEDAPLPTDALARLAAPLTGLPPARSSRSRRFWAFGPSSPRVRVPSKRPARARGRPRRAARRPPLLASRGELALAAGDAADARVHLERALSRGAGLDARVEARAKQLMAERA